MTKNDIKVHKWLKEALTAYIQERQRQNPQNPGYLHLQVIANKYQVSEGKISSIFRQLNQQGLVSQKLPSSFGQGMYAILKPHQPA